MLRFWPRSGPRPGGDPGSAGVRPIASRSAEDRRAPSRIIQAMPALAEIAPELINADVAAPEVAEPEVAEAAGAEVSTEGAVPDIGPNGMPLETGQTASEQAFGDKPTAASGEVDGGMYQPADYKAACMAAGLPDKWDDKYEGGHTEANQWDQPYDSPYEMMFTLKAGESASQALKAFIPGPTIASF